MAEAHQRSQRRDVLRVQREDALEEFACVHKVEAVVGEEEGMSEERLDFVFVRGRRSVERLEREPVELTSPLLLRLRGRVELLKPAPVSATPAQASKRQRIWRNTACAQGQDKDPQGPIYMYSRWRRIHLLHTPVAGLSLDPCPCRGVLLPLSIAWREKPLDEKAFSIARTAH